ncbi:DUF922 domain-containing protein [Niabella hirudinis]|uniref:DUF922 domain-containing protein n=1 Tax=Niabella hirudinis TaxID=1285929 RepID=UPI003EB7582F
MMRYLLAGLLFLSAACAPKMGSQITAPQEALADTAFVLVLKKIDKFENDGIRVGSIRSTDNGFSVNCSYYEVIEKLRQMARRHGANIIKITRDELPDKKSTCERIWADIYRVPDFRKHEGEIYWSPQRKLTWDDFKGTPSATGYFSFGAATSCDLKMESNSFSLLKKPKFYTEAVFNCYVSWVRPVARGNDTVLAHEQCHFDIGELYRRKMQRQLDESNLAVFGLQEAVNRIVRDVNKQMVKRNDAYDEETAHGVNKDRQREWALLIARELDALKMYEQHR